ncbi:hypothetical protein B0T24DRAFT_57387 [Lasiosphaeria ovina]|uniref:Uncharacterized protein n=1 Tax=Lasiosphaeria ovina TaxID=92902 RepID=A0AAE0NLA6_9PEZI|nr:hypothetical protein B0T24DRAFT_57387 [Lasiosphaeria ovina]
MRLSHHRSDMVSAGRCLYLIMIQWHGRPRCQCSESRDSFPHTKCRHGSIHAWAVPVNPQERQASSMPSTQPAREQSARPPDIQPVLSIGDSSVLEMARFSSSVCRKQASVSPRTADAMCCGHNLAKANGKPTPLLAPPTGHSATRTAGQDSLWGTLGPGEEATDNFLGCPSPPNPYAGRPILCEPCAGPAVGGSHSSGGIDRRAKAGHWAL